MLEIVPTFKKYIYKYTGKGKTAFYIVLRPYSVQQSVVHSKFLYSILSACCIYPEVAVSVHFSMWAICLAYSILYAYYYFAILSSSCFLVPLDLCGAPTSILPSVNHLLHLYPFFLVAASVLSPSLSRSLLSWPLKTHTYTCHLHHRAPSVLSPAWELMGPKQRSSPNKTTCTLWLGGLGRLLTVVWIDGNGLCMCISFSWMEIKESSKIRYPPFKKKEWDLFCMTQRIDKIIAQ